MTLSSNAHTLGWAGVIRKKEIAAPKDGDACFTLLERVL